MLDFVSQLAMLLGGPNGPQAAAEIDKLGIPPPPMKLGGPTDPTMGYSEMDQMPAVPAAPAAPAPTAPVAASPDLSKLALAANQGIKAPEPIKPIMSGGVTGGVKAPEMSGKVAGSAPAVQALMAALTGQAAAPDPLRVPALGALMRGGR